MSSTISLNVANFVTLKLTPENYTLWREQLLALAESRDMVGLLTGETTKPIMYTSKRTSTTDASSTSEATNQQISEEERMPLSATMVGALLGLGTQMYSNALRKLPYMRRKSTIPNPNFDSDWIMFLLKKGCLKCD